MKGEHDVKLQVLICTYGEEGIRRIAENDYPDNLFVQYIVSWQASDGVEIPERLANRDDFLIYRTDSVGLSKNRNHAFSKATAPLLLISDDDVVYTNDSFLTVIAGFRMFPDDDLIAFQYDSAAAPKFYPKYRENLSTRSKGYYISSIELAMRRESVVGKVWFNENFGIGARFPSGEEDLFVKDCLDAGLNCWYLPATIARHDGTTTSERNLMLSSRPQTKGAVFLRLHPRDWLLRMLVHAWREVPLWLKGRVPSPFSYCINWLRGVRVAKKLNVFSTCCQDGANRSE